MRLLLGRQSLVESIGPGIVDLVVVETNGDIEGVDTLKSCYAGAAATGLSVLRNGFAEAETAPPVASRQMGVGGLCEECQSCPYVTVCGGGYQPHRYSREKGFLNPSIYCDALQHLIATVAHKIRSDLEGTGAPVPPLVNQLSLQPARGTRDQSRG